MAKRLKSITIETHNDELNKIKWMFEEQQQIAHFGTWEWDILKNETSWSDEAYRIYGLEKERCKLNYQTVAKYRHPEDREKADEAMRAAIEERRQYSLDYRIIRPDGETRYIHGHGKVYYDGNGKPVRVLGTIQDVTESKKAEEDREQLVKIADEQRARLQAILDALPVGVWVADTEGRQTLANNAAADIFGCKAPIVNYIKEFSDYRLLKQGTKERLAWEEYPLSHALKGEPVHDMVLDFERVNGSHGTLTASSAPVLDAEGNIFGAVVEAQEITGHVKAAEALRASRAQLAEELTGLTLLQSISAELMFEDDIHALYEKITDTASKLMHSDFASLQMHHPGLDGNGSLQLLAHRGLTPPAAEFWEWAGLSSGSSCGEALRTDRRVIVPDVETCAFVVGTADEKIFRQLGIRACQTTPLYSRGGKLTGMISTHWLVPHRPTESQLRLLDVLARQAADLIERIRAGDALRASEERLRTRNTILHAINLVYEKAMECATVEQLGLACLEIVDAATQSAMGFIGEVGADGLLHEIAISDTILKDCRMNVRHRSKRQPLSFAIHGLYGKVLTSGKSLLSNTPASHPDSAGLPKGHVKIKSFLGVPFLHGGKVTGMIGVANRRGGYTDRELEMLEELAPTVLEVLLRKRAEEAQRLSEEHALLLAEALEKKNRLITDFFINISHEFKTPLTILMLGLELLEAKFAARSMSAADFNKNIAVMRQNSYRLNKLVSNLLDITKLDAGFMEPKWEDAEVVGLLSGLVASVETYARLKMINLVFNCAEREIPFTTDSFMLERIVLNLLSNAIKHTPAGGRITVTCQYDGKRMKVAVEDTGEGIPEEKKFLIFDRFTQVDTRMTRASEGSGIGLALSKSLAELMGGSVFFESTFGEGSTFTVDLPVLQVKARKDGAEQGSMQMDKRVQMELSDIELPAASSTTLRA